MFHPVAVVAVEYVALLFEAFTPPARDQLAFDCAHLWCDCVTTPAPIGRLLQQIFLPNQFLR
jgi:hypothetical protein